MARSVLAALFFALALAYVLSASVPAEGNYLCKVATQPIPMPCRDPLSYYTFPQKFYIGSWWPPVTTFDFYQIYKNAGYNVIMSPRYQFTPTIDLSVELARKLDLDVLIDPYLLNGQSYTNATFGGIFDDGIVHHIPTLPELKYLISRYTNESRIVGFLLGDDQCDMQQGELNAVLLVRQTAPNKIPWMNQICAVPGWNARVGIPYFSYETYATDSDVSKRVLNTAMYLNNLRNIARRLRSPLWPMLWTCPTDGINTFKPSIYYYQQFTALAYGAQGIWHFMWSECTFDLKTNTTINSVYDPLQRVNAKTAFYGQNYLLHRTSEQIFHTGVVPPDAYVPGKAFMIESMTDNILVGILPKYTSPDSYFSVMAMIVDKRVDFYNDVPPRAVTVTFSSLIKEVNILYQDHPQLVHGNSITVNLEGGDAVLVELFDSAQGQQMKQLLVDTGIWHYPMTSAQLLLPDDFYWYDMFYNWRQHSTMILGSTGPPAATEAAYSQYEKLGFTVVMSEDNELPYNSLNLAIKYGLMVYARPGKAISSLKALEDFALSVQCHSSLLGIELQEPVNEGIMQEVRQMSFFLRHNISSIHALVICSSGGVACSQNAAKKANIPTAYAQLKSMQNRTASVILQGQNLLNELDSYRSLIFLNSYTMIPVIQTCNVNSDSLLRFQAYASIAYGAQGLFFANYSTCFNPVVTEVVGSINYRIKAYSGILLGTRLTHTFSTGWLVANSELPGPGKIIVSMSDNVLATVLEKPGQWLTIIIVNKMLSTEVGGAPTRTVQVTFNSSVVSVGVFEAGCWNGFCTCREFINGPTATVQLPGGSAQMLQLNIPSQTGYAQITERMELEAKLCRQRAAHSSIMSNRENPGNPLAKEYKMKRMMTQWKAMKDRK